MLRILYSVDALRLTLCPEVGGFPGKWVELSTAIDRWYWREVAKDWFRI